MTVGRRDGSDGACCKGGGECCRLARLPLDDWTDRLELLISDLDEAMQAVRNGRPSGLSGKQFREDLLDLWEDIASACKDDGYGDYDDYGDE